MLMNAYGAKRNTIKMTRGEVFDSPPLTQAKGNVTQVGSTHLTGVFMESVLSRDLEHLKINGVLTIRSKDGEFQRTFYNNTLDLCEFLAKPFRHRILQFVQVEIMQNSNMPTKCPIHAGSYYIRNATFARARVPSFMPPSYFRVDINLLHVFLRASKFIRSAMSGLGLQWLMLWSFFGSMAMNVYGAKRNVIRLARSEIFDSPPGLRATGNVTQIGSTPLTGAYMELVVSRDLPHLKINGVLTIRSKDGELQSALYNNTLSVCEFFEQPFRHRILQIVQQEVMRNSNMPTKCPVRAGTYYIRNATFARARIPSFLPTSYFRVDLVAIGHRLELKNNIRSINISYIFRTPKRLVDQSIDFEVEVTRQIKDMKLVLAYYSGPKNVTTQNALLKRHVDLCFFLRNPKSDRLVNVVYQLVKDNGNMPTKCPFGPGSFYMRDLKPAKIPIPPFLPEAEFIFELIYRSELVVFATKVELKNTNKTFNVSYAFHNPDSLTNQTLDFNITSKRTLYDMKIVIVYYITALNGTIKNELLKRSIDVCFFLRNPRSDRLVNSLYSYIKQRSHLPSKCPIPVDTYTMRNIRLSDAPIPALLPESEFMAEATYYSGPKQDIMVSFRLYGKLLVPVANKIDFNYNVRSFNISYIFHQPTSITNQSLEFHIEMKRIIKDMKLLLVLHGLMRNGTISSVLLKRQVDICAFLRNTKSDRLLKSMYEYLNARGYLPTRCPFNPGHYYMCNLRLADLPVPAFLPETEIILELSYYSGVRSESFVELRMYGKLLVMSYYVIALNGTIQNTLLKRSIDICFFLRNPRSDRLVNSLYSYIKQRSHLPPRCPFPAGTYYMNNLRLSDMPLPALLPEAEFMVELGYYSGIKQEIGVSFRLYGKLLVAVAKRVDFKSLSRTFNVSHKIHNPKSVTNQSLDFDIEVTRKIKDMRNGTSHNALIKRPIDVCFFLRNSKSDRLVKTVYDYVNDRSNLPVRCPFGPGRYEVRNIRTTDVPVPSFLPLAEFILELLYYSEVRGEKMIEFRLHGKLIRLIAVGTKLETNCYGKVVNMSCAFRPQLAFANQTLDCEIKVFREIKELKLVVSYYAVAWNNLVQTVLLKRSLDMCFFIRNPQSDRLINSVYNYVRMRSNLPIRCPVAAGNYHIRNLQPSDVPIPSFLPESEFILEEIFRSEVKHETLVEFRFHGKLLVSYCTNMEFISKVKNINVSYTSYRPESISEQSFDYSIEITSPVRDLKLHFIYYAITGNGTSRMPLFKRAVDMCFYMQNPNSDRLLKVVYDYVRARTNLPKRCPIPAARYYIRNVRPTDVQIPAFLPESEFILELIYRNEVKRETMVEFRCFGKLLIPVGQKIELKSKVSYINASYTVVNRTESPANQTLDLEFNFTRQVQDIKLIFSYHITDEDGTIKSTIMKRKVDICFYLRNPNSDRLVKQVYDYIRARSKLPLKCPIMPGNYYMRNIRPADVPLPGFLPEASIILETNYWSEVRRELLIEYRYYGRLIIPVLNRMDCKVDKRYVNLSCSMSEPNSVMDQSVSMEIEMLREIKDIKLFAAYYIVTGSSVNRILKRTLDLCTFVKRPNSDRLVKLIYEQTFLYNRFVTGCPVPEKERFYIRNFRPSAIRVPAFLPESSFMLETSYHTGVQFEPIVSVLFYGRLMRVMNGKPLASEPTRSNSTSREIQGNRKYVNATIVDIGEHEFNKTYLIQLKALRIIRDLKVFMSYSVRAFDGAVQNELLSRWINGCEFLRRPNSDRLIKMCYDAVKKYSNISQCPYPVGNIMTVNITPSSFPVPAIIPKTDFKVEVKVFTNTGKDLLFLTRWYGGMANMERVSKNVYICEYGKNL
uniref:Uncharacterized protein n=1 Tax=Anopheles funestus TaxID=62324 RepID=A0A4Y0BKP7_ANOFN